MGKGLVLGGVIGIVVLIVAIMMGVHYHNAAIRLEKMVIAQKGVLEANFDKMWNILKNNADIKDSYKDDFKDVYVSIMEGRMGTGGAGSQGGTLALWIKEHNPQFDSAVYTKLMTAVEANRQEFFYEQKKVLSMIEQHDILRETFPSMLICGSRVRPEYKVVSATQTKAIMDSGTDDVSADMFKKKK